MAPKPALKSHKKRRRALDVLHRKKMKGGGVIIMTNVNKKFISGQLTYLNEKIEKILKEYNIVSDTVKEKGNEILDLIDELLIENNYDYTNTVYTSVRDGKDVEEEFNTIEDKKREIYQNYAFLFQGFKDFFPLFDLSDTDKDIINTKIKGLNTMITSQSHKNLTLKLNDIIEESIVIDFTKPSNKIQKKEESQENVTNNNGNESVISNITNISNIQKQNKSTNARQPEKKNASTGTDSEVILPPTQTPPIENGKTNLLPKSTPDQVQSSASVAETKTGSTAGIVGTPETKPKTSIFNKISSLIKPSEMTTQIPDSSKFAHPLFAIPIAQGYVGLQIFGTRYSFEPKGSNIKPIIYNTESLIKHFISPTGKITKKEESDLCRFLAVCTPLFGVQNHATYEPNVKYGKFGAPDDDNIDYVLEKLKMMDTKLNEAARTIGNVSGFVKDQNRILMKRLKDYMDWLNSVKDKKLTGITVHHSLAGFDCSVKGIEAAAESVAVQTMPDNKSNVELENIKKLLKGLLLRGVSEDKDFNAVFEGFLKGNDNEQIKTLLAALRDCPGGCNDNINNLVTKLSDLENELIASKKELASAKADLEKAQKEAGDVKPTNTTALNAKVAAAEAAQKAAEDAEVRASKIKNEIEALQAEIKESRAQLTTNIVGFNERRKNALGAINSFNVQRKNALSVFDEKKKEIIDIIEAATTTIVSQVEGVNRALENANGVLGELKTETASAETATSSLTALVESSIKEIAETGTATATATLERIQKQLDENIGNMDESLTRIQNETAQLIRTSTDALVQATTAASAIRDEIGTAQQGLSQTVVDTTAAVEAAKTAAEGAIASAVQAAKNEVAEATTEAKTAAEGALTTSTKAIQDADAAATTIQNLRLDNDTRIGELQSIVDSMGSTIGDLRSAYAGVSGQIADAIARQGQVTEGELDEIRASIAGLTPQIKMIGDNLRTYKASQDELSTNLGKLDNTVNGKIGDIEGKLKAIEDATAAAVAEADAKAAANAAAKAEEERKRKAAEEEAKAKKAKANAEAERQRKAYAELEAAAAAEAAEKERQRKVAEESERRRLAEAEEARKAAEKAQARPKAEEPRVITNDAIENIIRQFYNDLANKSYTINNQIYDIFNDVEKNSINKLLSSLRTYTFKKDDNFITSFYKNPGIKEKIPKLIYSIYKIFSIFNIENTKNEEEKKLKLINTLLKLMNSNYIKDKADGALKPGEVLFKQSMAQLIPNMEKKSVKVGTIIIPPTGSEKDPLYTKEVNVFSEKDKQRLIKLFDENIGKSIPILGGEVGKTGTTTKDLMPLTQAGGTQSPNIFQLLAYAQLGGAEQEEVARILEQDGDLNAQAHLIKSLISTDPEL